MLSLKVGDVLVYRDDPGPGYRVTRVWEHKVFLVPNCIHTEFDPNRGIYYIDTLETGGFVIK